MKTIIISGIDGSGKTSVINELEEELKKRGYKTFYIWLRFNHYFAKLMHAIARLLGLSVRVKNEMGTIWQHQLYKSSIFCYLYILTTYIDTLISKIKFRNSISSDLDFIICDRWINDIIIDLGTKTHQPNFLTSHWIKRFQKFVPKNAIQYVILRSDANILECRLENRLDPDFTLRNDLYKELCKLNFIVIINNNGTIKESVDQILKTLNCEK